MSASASATAVQDPRPKSMDPSVILACQASIVLAAGLSVTLNVYQHLHGHDLNPGIAWAVGVIVPSLVALLSHVAAHVKFHWIVKAWVIGITGALMYVSAMAGTTVLKSALTFGPALATSVGADLAALTMLGFLMLSTDLKAALEAWEGREAERLRQAEAEEIAARYGKSAGRVTGQGNGGGNTGGNGWGNTQPAIGGNTPLPAITVGSPPPGEVTGPAGTPEGEGNGSANVTQLRRPVQSSEELLTAAATMAADLAKIGDGITGRGYRAEFGGKPERVGPVVNDVKDALARLGGQATAAAIIAEVRAARSRAGQGTPVTAGAR